VTSGLGQLSVDDDDDDEEDEAKAKVLTAEERQLKAQKEREEKQKKYDVARERILGNGNATAAKPSGNTTQPTRGKVNGGSRGPSKNRTALDGRNATSSGSGAGPPRLYDPNYTAKPDSAFSPTGSTPNGSGRSTPIEQQLIRNPRGPDGSGRGGFGFASRGGKLSDDANVGTPIFMTLNRKNAKREECPNLLKRLMECQNINDRLYTITANMHLHTLLTLAAHAAFIAATPIADPEAEPQVPGLPTGLPASLTSKVASLLPAATAAANSIGLNGLPGVGGFASNLPPQSVPSSVPGVGGALPPPSVPSSVLGVGGALPPLSVPSSVPGVGGALPPLSVPSSVPGVGGNLPPLPVPTPGLPLPAPSNLPLPDPSNLPISPVPELPVGGGAVPSLSGLSGLPPPPTDPKQLLNNVTSAIQILQIVEAILGATGGGAGLNLSAGVVLGSGNPIVKLLIGLVLTLVGPLGLPAVPL
ncbi:MAG: hypothetical protein Q9192_008198, partial [Flavoplaca navasiana]